jgi:hypothetical protein
VAAVLGFCAHVGAADLLVGSDGSNKPNGILRYDGNTGAFLGRFVTIDRPISMTWGPDGNLYVGSISSMSVNRYNGTTGALLNTFVSTGSGGLGVPWDMTFGSDGNLYVASDGSAGGILRYNGSTGAFLDRFTTSPATGLTFGADGNLYVSVNEGVARYSGANGSKLADFIPSGPTLNSQYHLKFGPDANLYVMNARPGVRQYDRATGAYLRDFAVPPDPDHPLFLGLDFIFGPDGNLYMDNGEGSGVMRFNGTTGAFIDQFVPLGSGGLEVGRSMVFMVPEPGVLMIALAGLLVLRRR